MTTETGLSREARGVMYRLTKADAMSEYDVARVCYWLLQEARGAENEDAEIARIVREIVDYETGD